MQNKQRNFFLTFFLPPFILLMFFGLFSMLGVILLSFFQVDLKHPLSQVGVFGLSNYINLIKDQRFWRSVTNSFIWSVSTTLGSLVIGLALSLFIFHRFSRRTEAIVSTILVLPILISRVGVAQIWKLLLRPFGFLNYLLSLFGIGIVQFLANIHLAMLSVVIVDVWQWSFLVCFLTLSLLNGIPQSFLEEAEMMGAKRWQTHFYISLRIISPGILSIFFIKIVESLRTFDLIYNLTMGGPGKVTETLDLYAYYQGITVAGKISYAAAMSIVMLAITLIIITVLWNNTWKEAAAE